MGAVDERVEVVDGAELKAHREMSAVLATDRPWAPGIVGTGTDRVVASLTEGVADRVDRWQVHDVEPHRGDVRQALGRGVQTARAAREQLVPRTGTRSGPVHPDRG